ncbi:MAG TPA: hypothetical protein VHB98_01365, partial [Chloroflexota bacterium]|nr:hypothetical protein [Chloroflexota bacterium]
MRLGDSTGTVQGLSCLGQRCVEYRVPDIQVQGDGCEALRQRVVQLARQTSALACRRRVFGLHGVGPQLRLRYLQLAHQLLAVHPCLAVRHTLIGHRIRVEQADQQ